MFDDSKLKVEFTEPQIVRAFENSFGHPAPEAFIKSSGGGVTQYNLKPVDLAYKHFRLGYIKAANIANKLLKEAQS